MDKEMRLLQYAVSETFDGAMRDNALEYLNRLSNAVAESKEKDNALDQLGKELDRLKKETDQLNKELEVARKHSKRKSRQKHRLIKVMNDLAHGDVICSDGRPAMLGETLYGEDGRGWLIVGIATDYDHDLMGSDTTTEEHAIQPLKLEWLTHEPPLAEERKQNDTAC